MKYLGTALAAACSLATSIGLAQVSVKPSPSTPVEVTNNSSNPVPVTGAMQITNGSANPVAVTGTGSVNILGTPGIRNLDSEGRQPYVAAAHDAVGSSSNRCAAVGCDLMFPAVPAGKRLVIKHVTVRLASAKKMLGGELYLIPTSPPGAQNNLISVFLAAPYVVPANGSSLFTDWSIISQEIFATVEAGVQPLLAVTLDLAAPFDGLSASLTGYLVDAP